MSSPSLKYFVARRGLPTSFTSGEGVIQRAALASQDFVSSFAGVLLAIRRIPSYILRETHGAWSACAS